MKKSLIFVLALVMVSVFAVGCSSNDETVIDTATQAPEMTVEATMEATVEATVETTTSALEDATVEDSTAEPAGEVTDEPAEGAN